MKFLSSKNLILENNYPAPPPQVPPPSALSSPFQESQTSFHCSRWTPVTAEDDSGLWRWREGADKMLESDRGAGREHPLPQYWDRLSTPHRWSVAFPPTPSPPTSCPHLQSSHPGPHFRSAEFGRKKETPKRNWNCQQAAYLTSVWVQNMYGAVSICVEGLGTLWMTHNGRSPCGCSEQATGLPSSARSLSRDFRQLQGLPQRLPGMTGKETPQKECFTGSEGTQVLALWLWASHRTSADNSKMPADIIDANILQV